MAEMEEKMTVTIVSSAGAGEITCSQHQVNVGTTIGDLLQQSGFWQAHPEFDVANTKVGLYNHVKSLDILLRDKDRIEVYRPLIVDPKTARHLRVAKKRQKKK